MPWWRYHRPTLLCEYLRSHFGQNVRSIALIMEPRREAADPERVGQVGRLTASCILAYQVDAVFLKPLEDTINEWHSNECINTPANFFEFDKQGAETKTFIYHPH